MAIPMAAPLISIDRNSNNSSNEYNDGNDSSN